MTKKFRGMYTALVTPFTANGASVDSVSLKRLIDFQVSSGVTGFVVCGSTGEAATLSESEYIEVVRLVREHAADKPVVAGVSVSATDRAVALAKLIEELGCDGILLATPPYNKPSQDGIVEHFVRVRAATQLPIMAYNIPSRTGVAMHAETLGKLSREGIIEAIKESSGSLDAFLDVRLAVGDSCVVLSGEDSMFSGTLACGGQGIVSASANVIPEEFCRLWEAWCDGNGSLATEIQLSITPKIRKLFLETNPVPVKAVLAKRGIIDSATVRLPLVPLTRENYAQVCEAFV